MQGIGNDFVVVAEADLGGLGAADLARTVCDRRTGIGADGLLVVGGDPLSMTVYNADGSVPEMCGNGLRCVARFAALHGHEEPELTILTGAGTLVTRRESDGQISIAMGRASLTRGEIGMVGPAQERFIDQELVSGLRGTAVSMGNPHLVILTEDLENVDLEFFGPRLETHPFFPARVNVHYAQVEDRGTIRMRSWERGVGVTLACGTGACAVAVACHTLGLTDLRTNVRLPGGPLKIELDGELNVRMTGDAVIVFEGIWPGGDS